jgi:hypothetical protein
VLKYIAHRRVEDRRRLNRILDSEGSSDIRNFQEQERLLGGAQARVADLDMEKLSDAMRACCGPHQLVRHLGSLRLPLLTHPPNRIGVLAQRCCG